MTEPSFTLARPRVTDYFGVYRSQAELDFAIQFLNEDIPLYVDPFLLWNSPSQQDQALHTVMTGSFNKLSKLVSDGNVKLAKEMLIGLSECDEVGLGVSSARAGHRIGDKQAEEILGLFGKVEYKQKGFEHFETIQLYVDGISKDRISDIACNLLKSFLVDFTIEQCEIHKIPREKTNIDLLFDSRKFQVLQNVPLELPVNPTSNKPLIFVPKRWLRYTPWINFDDYFKTACPADDIFSPGEELDRVKVLNYNRENYGVVSAYIERKLREAEDCRCDPLFSQIPVLSAKRKLKEILALPAGKSDQADRKFEDGCSQLLASVLYPHLDFAEEQVRTESGRSIRDLVFYNNRSIDFLDEIFSTFGNRQLVFELKNVAKIEREHINQLNRYAQSSFGNFAVFVTRNDLPSAMFKNTVDLWSSQRKCIIALTDADLQQMVDLYEGKQRDPLDVVKKKFIEFRRACPS